MLYANRFTGKTSEMILRLKAEKDLTWIQGGWKMLIREEQEKIEEINLSEFAKLCSKTRAEKRKK
jgi:hypothetical protein